VGIEVRRRAWVTKALDVLVLRPADLLAEVDTAIGGDIVDLEEAHRTRAHSFARALLASDEFLSRGAGLLNAAT
jgi:hypothetical protein